jgi:hypothetical protein
LQAARAQLCCRRSAYQGQMRQLRRKFQTPKHGNFDVVLQMTALDAVAKHALADFTRRWHVTMFDEKTRSAA